MPIRRICLTTEKFFSWWSISLFLGPYCVIEGWYCNENLDEERQVICRGWRVNLGLDYSYIEQGICSSYEFFSTKNIYQQERILTCVPLAVIVV